VSFDEPLKTGFHAPEQCFRGRRDCRSLAQLLSSGDPITGMCLGEVLEGATPDPRDKWCFCVRGMQDRDYCEGTDVRLFVDQQDMSHMAAVLSMGLAWAILPEAAAGDKPSPSAPAAPCPSPLQGEGR
jgi:hypothetical protein